MVKHLLFISMVVFISDTVLKPIFHCDAKPFALGTGVGLDPQRHTFASPNAKYTNMLVYFGVT